MRFSRSKLDEDAVDRIAVVPHKLASQSPEKRSLLLVERLIGRGFMMVVIPLHHFDTSMTATVDSFNRIGTHEYRNIAANRHFGDVELVGQIVICIVPSQAQHFQQFLAALCGTHALTPPSVALGGNHKLSCVRVENTRKKYLKFFYIRWGYSL